MMSNFDYKNDIPQIWILFSPLPLPLGFFAIHCWIVTYHPHQKLTRWEVWWKKEPNTTRWGFLHKNLLPPGRGMRRWPWGSKKNWPAEFIGTLSGDSALRLIKKIDSGPQDYPYLNRYHAWPGPNSNTYIQWLLNDVNELNLKLPFRALGKGYLVSDRNPLLSWFYTVIKVNRQFKD